MDAKQFIAARKYGYRSGLELKVADYLKEQKCKYKYEALKIEWEDLTYRTYTPDFVDPKGRWVIECKGYANERFPLKWKMFKQLLMQQDDPPVLFVPRNQRQNIETVTRILEIMAPTK